MVAIVGFLGEIYNDAETVFPEIEIEGTTTFALSHLIPTTALQSSCGKPFDGKSAADAALEKALMTRVADNARASISFFIRKTSLFVLGLLPI